MPCPATDSVYGEMHRAGKDAMLKLMEAEREGEQVGWRAGEHSFEQLWSGGSGCMAARVQC